MWHVIRAQEVNFRKERVVLTIMKITILTIINIITLITDLIIIKVIILITIKIIILPTKLLVGMISLDRNY